MRSGKRRTVRIAVLIALSWRVAPAGDPPAAADRDPSPRATDAGVCVRRPAPRLAVLRGKVVTVTKGVLEGGAVLLSGGKIERVLAEPPDAETLRGYETIDARDLWVLPGFVDVHSHVGGSDINDVVYPTNPGFRVLDTILPSNPLLKRAQAGGVTAILFLPGSGTNLSGFAALIKTGGETLEEALVRFPAALKVAQGGNPERHGGDLGLGPMGMTTLLRSALEEGKRYSELWDAYEAGKSSERPAFNPRLDYFRKVFRKEIPVLVHTQGYLLVEKTLRLLHDEFDLWVIVGHGELDAPDLAAEVARKGVFVAAGPRAFDFDSKTGAIVGLALRWREGGVKDVAVITDAGVVPQEELFLQGAMAARLGLDEEVALRAMTIHAASAIGAEDRLGSIEEGKDADIVLWSGNPLDASSHVVLTVIDGRITYDTRREPRRF